MKPKVTDIQATVGAKDAPTMPSTCARHPIKITDFREIR